MDRRVAVAVGAIVVVGVAAGAFAVANSGGSDPPTSPPTSTPPAEPIEFHDLSEAVTTDATSITVTAPVLADDGDIMIAVLLAPGTQLEREGRKHVGPDGWTYIQGALHASWWWRQFTPDDADQTWTWSAQEVGRQFTWNAFIYAYGGVDGSDPVVGRSVAPACSQSSDPVCDREPGTAGQLIAPPAESVPGSVVLAWYTSHSRGGNVISLPGGFEHRSQSLVDQGGAVTIAGDLTIQDASLPGPVAATTSVPDFVHGIAGLVVLRPA